MDDSLAYMSAPLSVRDPPETFLLDTDYEHPKCRNFVKNLLNRKKEWIFSFVMDPEVESTCM